MTDRSRSTTDNDVKRRFSEALERKNQTAHDRATSDEGRYKPKSLDNTMGQKRFFRRKTG